MKIKIFITLLLIFAAGIGFAQGICLDWLPVYLCYEDTFDISVCHDTLNPGYIYDSIYIWSSLENIRTGSSGHWYNLDASEIPILANQSYFDTGTNDWIFGWDSVYIRADSGGIVAAESTFWIFNYPPDSGWIDATMGLTICPNDSGIFYAKWLNVGGAFFWNWQSDSQIITNDFVHSEIIDTTVCIKPDHQSYSAPDSLSPGAIDTLYDPCPMPICTTFTLLPTDVVGDTMLTICRNETDTVILSESYGYDHLWIYESGTLSVGSSMVDTLIISPTNCGTSWVYYDISGAGTCSPTRLDSIAIFVPCQSYDIVVNSTIAHDTGDYYCPDETLSLCLDGDSLNSSDICWDLPGADDCDLCISYVVDTSFWAYVHFTDRFGCQYSDSIYIPVNRHLGFEFTSSKGCAGEPITFTITPDSLTAVEFVIIQFGDETWDVIDTVDSLGNYSITHTYGATGNYTAYATVYDTNGCFRMDSIWVRQSEIIADLSVESNPACRGSQIYLDASSSVVNPSGDLIYRFYDPNGDSIYFGDTPNCIDTAESSGIWYVWVIDTAAGCSSYASVSVDLKWVQIFAPDTIAAISGCERCIEISAIPHNCTDSIDFGYADSSGSIGELIPLASDEFCSQPDTTTRQYYLYVWCADCPDSRDSSLITVIPVDISATAHDTILCYGQFIPNLLDTFYATPSGMQDSVVCQVIYTTDGTGDIDTILNWTSPASIPDEFDWFPTPGNGIITYRFALDDAYGCAYEISARVTLHHPVAVLNIRPNDIICSGHIDTLDASASYSNCTGANLCYRYFELIDGVLIPFDNFADSLCCDPACSIYVPTDIPDVGNHTYAVEVCMQDVPWCCDTAYITLDVCDIGTPLVSIVGECSSDTIMAGAEIEFDVIDADSFDNFQWFVNDSPAGDSSILLYTQSVLDTLDSIVVELCAYNCEFACTSCVSDTYYLDYPPIAESTNLVAYEDSCPFIAFIGDSVIDREGDSLIFTLISGPDGISVDSAGTLRWDCPTNCDIGNFDISIEATEQNSCEGTCTLSVSIDVMNTFAGIYGMDSLWGFSCIDSANFIGDTLTLYNSSNCYDLAMMLTGDDVDECGCGFWSAGSLFWLDIDPSGLVGADLYEVPRGTYYETIYLSDCTDTDFIVLGIVVPNHIPRAASVPYEIWIPSGYDTIAITSSDFTDLDSDIVSIDNVTLTNSSQYSLSVSSSNVEIQPSPNYRNFPGIPDTLTVTASDGYGGNVTTTILVWSYNPSDIRPENRKPSVTTIVGAYPNPFNTSVWVEVENDGQNNAKLVVLDYTGKIVNQLFDGALPAGVYRFKWNGKDMSGETVPSGKYWFILNIGGRKYSLPVQFIK